MTDDRRLEGRGRWLVPAALAVAALAVLVVAQPSVSPTAVLDDEGGSEPVELADPPDGEPREGDDAGATPGPSGEPEPDAADAGDGEVAAPTSVTIPAIDVEKDLVELGLLDDGAMEVPDFGDAGWYTRGPKPGQPGGAVIAAHYDSTEGPDVFYDLADLEPGDEVRVDAADGRTGTWEVVDAERTPKDELPAERIWPDTDEPRLALVTCGGVFDEATGHYTHNDVVYAEWQGWHDA